MKFERRAFGPKKKVSLFTLGTMRAIESIEQMYSVLKEASLIGINHIETAPSYGPAETLLGESIKKLDDKGIFSKDKWVISSKILPNKTFSEGKQQLKRTLQNLQLNKIDNLAVHGLNLSEHLFWAIEGEGARLLDWAQQEEKVCQVGFSSHGSESLIKEAICSDEFQFCSLHVHLLNQTNLPLAKLALEKGMGVLAISPADKGGHLHSPSKELIEDCWPIHPLLLAYRFLLSEGISTLSLGAQKIKDFALAKQLMNSFNPLTKVEKKCLKNLFTQRNLRLGKTFCGECRNCLPCPQNVPIPELLRLRNLYIGHGLKSFAKERYNLIGRAGHWWEEINANACKSCGDCLERCPNDLNIPKLLEEVHLNLLDNPKRRLWD